MFVAGPGFPRAVDAGPPGPLEFVRFVTFFSDRELPAMHKKIWVWVAAALVLAFVGVAGAGEGGDEWVGKPAPEFTLSDLDGNTYRLSDLRGKVVWLNFWGLRCGPCVRELPALQKLWTAYKDQGLVLLAVNADGVDAKFIKGQLAKRDDLKAAGMTFPITPDPEFKVIDGYGLMGAPLNVMIDKKGVIRFRHEGYEEGDEAGYEKTLKALLAE